jgi:hypothetical protein
MAEYLKLLNPVFPQQQKIGRYLPKMLRDCSKLKLRRSSQSITDG